MGIREIKPEIRVLGVDDGVFTPHSKQMVDVVGVVFRGGYWLDGFMHTQVRVDGMDSTGKLTQMILNSPHHKQLRVIMLNGVTLAGFNVVDIAELYRDTRLPVIAITRNRPDFKEIKNALQHLPQAEERWNAIKKAGKIITMHTREDNATVYAHAVGVAAEAAKHIVQNTATRSIIPEPLRVAHIIASGLKGRQRAPELQLVRRVGKALKDSR
jgi:endonuclease V-like protein UPF0215 family